MSIRSPHDYPAKGTLAALVEIRTEHVLALTRHRHVEALPVAEVRDHTLAVLAVSERIAREARAPRWVFAVDALAAAATLSQVAEAMGLDEDEVRHGLGRWADEQVRHELMTPARRAEVLALVGGERS